MAAYQDFTLPLTSTGAGSELFWSGQVRSGPTRRTMAAARKQRGTSVGGGLTEHVIQQAEHRLACDIGGRHRHRTYCGKAA